ncbi:MAG: fused MFS/spermidine synthase, partial [Micromonosporaceae bacterium]|nr:fused MFS/spermidine synthase [Micromonosporaceae bacterium]
MLRPGRDTQEPRAPVDVVKPLPTGLAAALVFLASGAVLVLEVVGLRLVGPYVGVTLQTSSAVIGVALAAIAYGAWLGGWLADRWDPRRLLAPALLLAAVATAFTLPLVRYAGEALREEGGAIRAAGGILLLTTLTLFVPAALLSTIPPLVVKLQLGDLAQTGRVVGRLSSIGTLGAITATLGTGFVLVAALPSSVIMFGLAGLLGAGGLGLAIYLRVVAGVRSTSGRRG